MNVSAEHKKAKREQILSEGLRLMHGQGYNATGIKDITDAAGIPKGSFYNYFDSKEDFAVAAMQYYYDLYSASDEDALRDSQLPPLERLRALFERRRIGVVERQKFSRGCFINNMCQEMADHGGTISQNISRHIRNSRFAMAACLAEAQQRGDIAADYDVEQLAQFIDNAWKGVITTAKAEHSEADFDGFMNLVFNKLLR